MAITYTKQTRGGTNYAMNALAAENFKIITGSWTMGSTYATGGVTANLATLGFASGQIMFANFTCQRNNVMYDYANDKLKMFAASATDATVFTEAATNTTGVNCNGYFVVMGYGAH